MARGKSAAPLQRTTGELSFGQRFRFNNLAQTYAKYHDMWRKKMMQKETGMQQHHFGAAAKAIEAERARKAAKEQPATDATKSSRRLRSISRRRSGR